MMSVTANRESGDTTAPVELDIGGMSCASCSARIERKLNKLNGVRASVNYATERAIVHGVSADDTDRVVEAVGKAGYTAVVRHPRGEGQEEGWLSEQSRARISSLRRRLAVAAILTIPLCDLTILFALVPDWRFPQWQLACVLLAVPIVSWAAWPFHRATVRGIVRGSLSMDTLVSLGSLASFGWAVFTMLFGASAGPGYWLGFGVTPDGADAIYLDVAAGMITFQLGGRYFEARSRRRASGVLNALNALSARQARILRAGTEQIMPISDLHTGDTFIVLPGERVPADGNLLTGRTTVDTSSMTGESLPAELDIGDPVVGGTINISSRIEVLAERVGPHTQLAQMAALAEEAQQRKAKVQALVDTISRYFIPAVIVTAVVVMLAWYLFGADIRQAFGTGIAVLIIACPCALGLATPTALMVGVGRGSQLGILLKGQDALEASGVIDTVVFDKTGTVTTGDLSVDEVLPMPGYDADRILHLAAAVETGSGHAIGTAIIRTATDRRRRAGAGSAGNTGDDVEKATDYESFPGLGASATVGSRRVEVGSPRLAAERGITIPTQIARRIDDRRAAGNTAVLVSVDGHPAGVLILTDTIKDSAPRTIRALQDLGLNTILLTGDAPGPAAVVGEAVGIDEVIAEVLPTQKATEIARLQAQGHKVAMVGDGVNDAVALATANLGLAMVRGTDIAMKSADIILVRDDLDAVTDAVLLARRTLRTIRLNLVWAFGYNIAAIPIAAAGLLNPLIAAAAMAVSSVLVISNSLRLRNFRS